MSAPSITSVTFDKASYAVGDTITATVNYADGRSDATEEFDVLATNSATKEAATLKMSFTVASATDDPTDVEVSDAGNRTWTKASDADGVAVFTATA